jgi:glutamine amidotransferase
MINKKIVIIDYGIGNVKSMCNAFYNIGLMPELTSNKKTILNADAVVLPGVGAFNKGMENLKERGLYQIIHEYIKKGKPFLGVCLGMQMLMEESEEFGLTPGLGLIKGKVVKLPKLSNSDEKLPHVSWNELNKPQEVKWKGTIFDNIPVNSDAYFVHSFVSEPINESDILSTTNYAGVNFCSAVKHENIYGTQFHPEKSSHIGLSILANFVKL